MFNPYKREVVVSRQSRMSCCTARKNWLEMTFKFSKLRWYLTDIELISRILRDSSFNPNISRTRNEVFEHFEIYERKKITEGRILFLKTI